MRFLSSLLGGVIVAIAAVLLTLFALENPQTVSLNFLGTRFSGNVWWLILGAAAVGVLLALLLIVPGRMMTGHRANSLSRANAEHERNLAELRDTHAQLQAERDRIAGEHDSLGDEFRRVREELVATRSERDHARQDRDQLATERNQFATERDQLQDEHERMTAERDQLRARLDAMPVPALAGAATTVEAAREDQVVAHEVPEGPATAEARSEEDLVVAREPVATRPANPSLGERIRAAVTRQPVEETQTQDAAQDAAHDTERAAARDEAEPDTMPEVAPGDEAQRAEAGATNEESAAAEAASEEPGSPSLGERLRAVFTGQPVDEVQTQDARHVEGYQDEGYDAGHDGERTDGERADGERTAGAEPVAPEARVTSEEPGAETGPGTDHVGDHVMAADMYESAPVAAEPTMTSAEAAPEMATPTADGTTEPTLGERLHGLFYRPEYKETPPA